MTCFASIMITLFLGLLAGSLAAFVAAALLAHAGDRP
jgi:hypothetical protein